MAFKGDLDALILGALDGVELHGYQIAKQIRRLSQEALSVGEGQLYPALHVLEQKALVSAIWEPQENKPPRKVYRLTESGSAALARKRNDWKRFAEGVAAVLGGPAPIQEAQRG